MINGFTVVCTASGVNGIEEIASALPRKDNSESTALGLLGNYSASCVHAVVSFAALVPPYTSLQVKDEAIW